MDNGDTYVYNFDSQFQTAEGMDDVSSSDHLLAVVDDVTGKADPALGGGDAGGLSIKFGKIAYIQNTSNMGFLIDQSVHEIGHNLGLSHEQNGNRNYMSYDQDRRNFTPLQMVNIYYNAINGRLNQGSNSERAIKSTNNWFYNTSSNVAPYYKNVSKGERMPTTIPN